MATNSIPIDRREVDGFLAELYRVSALGRSDLPVDLVARLKAIHDADYEGIVCVRLAGGVIRVELAQHVRDLVAELREIA